MTRHTLDTHQRAQRISRGIAFALFCTALVFGIVQGYYITRDIVDTQRAQALDSINDRLESVLVAVNSIPRSVGNDLLFLSQLSSLDALMHEKTPEGTERFEQDLLSFLQENTIYATVEHYDADGEFTAGAWFDGAAHYATSTASLFGTTTTLSAHLSRIAVLNEGSVYISFIELLDSKTLDGGSDVYILHYGTPIIRDGVYHGSLVARVYADYFLDDIRHASREGEELFLVDNNGRYLAHPERAKEYNGMSRSASLYTDYPHIAADILSGTVSRHITRQDTVMTVRYIYPTSSSFALHHGSEQIFGEDPAQHYFWALVSVSDSAHIDRIAAHAWTDYAMVVLVILALLGSALIVRAAAHACTITALRNIFGTRNVFSVVIATVAAFCISIVYFFAVTSFFQGWQHAKWFDAVPDLVTFIIASALAAYALHLSGRARLRITLGSACIGIQSLIELPLQEYQEIVGVLGAGYWVPLTALEGIGFFLLLFGVVALLEDACNTR